MRSLLVNWNTNPSRRSTWCTKITKWLQWLKIWSVISLTTRKLRMSSLNAVTFARKLSRGTNFSARKSQMSWPNYTVVTWVQAHSNAMNKTCLSIWTIVFPLMSCASSRLSLIYKLKSKNILACCRKSSKSGPNTCNLTFFWPSLFKVWLIRTHRF